MDEDVLVANAAQNILRTADATTAPETLKWAQEQLAEQAKRRREVEWKAFEAVCRKLSNAFNVRQKHPKYREWAQTAMAVEGPDTAVLDALLVEVEAEPVDAPKAHWATR